MDEATRDVPDFRALLQAHGPATLFQAIQDACAQPPEGDPALWARTAAAARAAVAELLADDAENDAPDIDQGEGDELPDADDAQDDQGGGDELPDDEGDGEELPNEGEDGKASPGAPRDDAATPSERKPRKVTTMGAKQADDLGARPLHAMSWGLRLLGTDGKWSVVRKRESMRHESSEWPIKTCSLVTIMRDWPDLTGEVRVQYFGVNAEGHRRGFGHSRTVPLFAAESENPSEPKALEPSPAPSFAAIAPAAGVIDPMAHAITLMGLVRDAEERTRIAAREEARLQAERYKADTELQKERERLASAERIAQIEAQTKVMMRTAGAPQLDSRELVTQIGQVLGQHLQRVEEAIGEIGAPASAPPPAEPPPVVAMTPAAIAAASEPPWVGRLFNILEQIVPGVATQVMATMLTPSAPAAAPAPQLHVVDGGSHAAE